MKRFVLAGLFVLAAFAAGSSTSVHRAPSARPIAAAEPQVWPDPHTAFDPLRIPLCYWIKDTAPGTPTPRYGISSEGVCSLRPPPVPRTKRAVA